MTINRRVLIGSLGIALTTIAATTAGIAQNNAVPEEYRYVDVATIPGVAGQARQPEKKCKPKDGLPGRAILGTKAC